MMNGFIPVQNNIKFMGYMVYQISNANISYFFGVKGLSD